MFRVRMPLYNVEGEVGSDPGVEEVPAAEEQQTDSQTGVESQADAEPGKQNNFEKAFAKRLAAEREKWEADKQKELEQYKDFDVYKKATEYLQKTSGINDVMTLRERIELEELQERAEQQNVPPEVLKRIDELEHKAAKAEEYERLQSEQQQTQAFEQSLKEFCEGKDIDGKPVDHVELWNYMHEHGVSKPDVALKAMKADLLEQKIPTLKESAIKEYLESKRGPRVEGSTGAAGSQTVDTSKLGWNDVERVAAERLRAARQPS